jgi:hypothetical protein
MSSERNRRKERSSKRAEAPLEAVSTCNHTSTVSVAERGAGRRRGGPTTICRTCHAMKRHFSTRWRKQSATPAEGAAMMPFVPHNGIPADCCIVKWNDSEPPFLIPTVPAGFEPELVVGQRAAFLVYDHPRQFISAKVVYFGENKRGERGYVALTEQGLTVRGSKGVHPLSGGGTETSWDACIFGLEAHLARNVAAHRQKYPRKVPPRPPS